MVTRAGALVAVLLASAGVAAPLAPQGANPWLHGAGRFRHVVRSLAVYRGDLWVGTYGHGAYRRGADGWRRVRHADSELPEDRVNTLTVHQGRLWFGTCAGLAVRDGEAFVEHVRAGPGSVAHDIYHVVKPLPGGGLGVGTTGHGLSVLADGGWTTYGKDQGLLDLWINDLVGDPDGTVWVATGAGLYAGSDGRWREHHARGEAPPLDTEFTALARQGKTLWTGTMGEGLWGLRDGSWIRVPSELLPGRQVLALLVDGEERLWVGTEHGLARYRFDEGFREVTGPLASEEVKVLHQDEAGVLRVGTRGGRVYAREGGAFVEVLRIDPETGQPAPEPGAAAEAAPSPAPAPPPGAARPAPDRGSGR